MNIKIYFLTFLLTTTFVNVFSKSTPGTIEVKIVQPNVDGKNYFEDESVKISFTWEGQILGTRGNNLTFRLENKTSERIYIEWENARTNGDRVILGEDSKVTYRNKKEDEAVSANSSSMLREFFKERTTTAVGIAGVGLGLINGWADHVYGDINTLFETGKSTVDFLIPVRFSDGKTTDYKLTVSIRYINTAPIEEIKVGMKDKDVKDILGSPNKKQKVKVTDTEYWQYTNNAMITLVKDKVTNIEMINRE